MKRTLLIAILLFISTFHVSAQYTLQIDSNIITDFSSSVPVHITTSLNGSPVDFDLDLDNNSDPDIRIKVFRYSQASFGDEYYLKMQTMDNCKFAMDTVMDSIGFLPPIFPSYYATNVPIVKKYEYGNIVHQTECLFTGLQYITRYYLDGPSQIYVNSLDNWIGGIHYIGISKVINGVNYLGWLKTKVTSYYDVTFLGFVLKAVPVVSVNENNLLQFNVYPNPASSSINIMNGDCTRAEIYDVLGSLKLSAENYNQVDNFTMDLNSLNTGYYLLRIYDHDKFVTRKIFKE